jgi:16S rRNA (guanine966-N2)-methyltransferase
MRIIGGKFKGRRFSPPADKWPTRPTTDFAKEGLFNVLNNLLDFEDSKMLDLFGGTGSHCFEFLSRGAAQAVYVDKFPPALQFARKTALVLGIEDKMRIIRSDVFKFIAATGEDFDYVFADPPYDLDQLDEIPDLVFAHKLLRPEGIFVLEHGQGRNFENHPHFLQSRNYGSVYFSFFQLGQAEH